MNVKKIVTWVFCIVVAGFFAMSAYTQISSGIGSPMTAIIALVLAAVAGWLRKGEAIGLPGNS